MSFKTPRALTNDFGIITLAGDLGGTAATPSVLKVNGVSYPTSPGTNTVPVVTSSNTITYQQIADAQISSSAAIAVSKLAAGSTTQVLITNGTTPTWTTLSSDVTNNATGVTTVNSISGSSPVNITTAATFQWSSGVSTPSFTQAAPASASTGTAATNMSYSAQTGGAATSTTGGAGGNLTVSSGAGGAGTASNAGGGAAGVLNLKGGAGGNATGSGTTGNGGNVVLTPGAAGTGGAGGGTAGNVNIQTSGASTIIQVTSAGAANLTASAASQFTTSSGALTITGAAASTWSLSANGSAGGAGFALTVASGAGGAGATSTAGGNAGVAELLGGTGGAGGTTGAGGTGGVSEVVGGTGGAGGSASGGNAGAGGQAELLGGTGGNATVTGTTAGTGGNITVDAGAAGTASGGASAGTNGSVSIANTNATSVTIGNTANTTTITINGTTSSTIALTPPTIQWATGVTMPAINQVAASGAGTSLTVKAQNAGGNSSGGNLVLSGGNKAGTGFDGYVFLEAGGNVEAFVNSSLLNFSAGGLGIGTTPGTDPTISRGTGVPATTQPNGSIFLRTDGSSGSTGVYTNQGQTWFAVGGSGAGTALTGPVTSTVRTNSTNATYTIDTTGGGSDYLILNSNTLTALTVTFSVTNGSQVVTSSASTTISGGTCIVFGSDAVAYVIATTGTSTTTFTLSTAYQGSTASNVVASTFSYYAANYTLPTPTAGRILQIKDTTGFLETNPINILPNGSESIEKRNSLLTVNTPFTVVNGSNFVNANPMLQPLPVISFNVTNDSTGTTTGNIYVSYTPALNSSPQALTTTTVVGTNAGAATFTTNGTTTVTVTGGTPNVTFIAGQLIRFSNQTGTFYTVASTLAAGTSLTLTSAATNTNASGLTVVRVGEALSGTFNLNGQAANTNISTTVSQVSALFVGSPVVFGTQPNTTYFVSSVTSTNIQLTAQYTGATNATAVAAQPSGILYPGSKMAFSTQPGATYGVATIFTPGGTGDTVYYNNGGRTWTTTNNSASITASTSTTTVAGDVIQFSNQVGTFYSIASAATSTAQTLTTNFTGTGTSGLYVYKYAAGILLAGTPVTFNLNGQAANTNIATTSDLTTVLVVGSAIIFGTQPNTTYIISSVTSTNIQLTTNYTGATNATAVAGSPITLTTQTTGIKLMEKYGGGANATTTAGNTLVSVVFTCTNGSTSVGSLFNGTAFSTSNILFPGSNLLFFSYNSGATTLTIQSGTGASTSSCSYTISSISGATITLTATFGGTTTAAINYQSTTTNFQSLGGTFSITNGSALVTATQSQTGFVDVGSQIYFINSGSLNTNEGSVQTIAGMSADGKTIQLSATYAGTTRAAASAVADLTALSIGGVGMVFGGTLGSILFGSDTTYYPMINISPGQTLLYNSTNVTIASGDFSVTNGSRTVTSAINQGGLLDDISGGNFLVFGNQQNATYSTSAFDNANTITLSSNFTGSTSTNVSASVIGINSTVSLSNGSTNASFAGALPGVVTGTPFIPLDQTNTVLIFSQIGNGGVNVITTTYTGPSSSRSVILLSTAPILQLSSNYTGSTATVTSAKLTNYSYTTNNGILQLTYDSTSSSWYVTN